MAGGEFREGSRIIVQGFVESVRPAALVGEKMAQKMASMKVRVTSRVAVEHYDVAIFGGKNDPEPDAFAAAVAGTEEFRVVVVGELTVKLSGSYVNKGIVPEKVWVEKDGKFENAVLKQLDNRRDLGVIELPDEVAMLNLT